MYHEHCFILSSKSFKSILIGDSLIAGLNRYLKISKIVFKTIKALNCDIGGNKVQNVLWRVQNIHISSSLKNSVILCDTNNLHQDFPEDIVNDIIKIGPCFKEQHHHINVFICGLLPCDVYTPVNGVYITNQQNIKSKMLVEQVHLYLLR